MASRRIQEASISVKTEPYPSDGDWPYRMRYDPRVKARVIERAAGYVTFRYGAPPQYGGRPRYNTVTMPARDFELYYEPTSVAEASPKARKRAAEIPPLPFT